MGIELNKMYFKDEIRNEFLRITCETDETNISDGVIEAIERQGIFFGKNQSLFEEYKDMLLNYNYYTRERIEKFLLDIMVGEDYFIFTSLSKEEGRPESSSIIYPLLFNIRENSKAETFTKRTVDLFDYVIRYKEEMKAYHDLLAEEGPSYVIEELYYDIKKRAKSYNIQRIDSLEKIIIFEDFVGIGTSLIEKFLGTDGILAKLNKIRELNIKILFLFLEISKEGKDKLDEFLHKNSFDRFISYAVPSDTQNFKTYTGNYQNLSREIGIKDAKYSLQALVSTYLETPNNTIALFWKEKQDLWKPLFTRTDAFSVYNGEDEELLQKTLDKYDFRKSRGIELPQLDLMHFNPKVTLMVLVLLQVFSDGISWEKSINIVEAILKISKTESSEIISRLQHAKFIKFNDNISKIELTKKGKKTITEVELKPNTSDFIDESVLSG
ncbi:phosphoribosyltransferase-like protein [Streptococcus halichoeri]|uniref:phosphoribosyltransferase-like protein n=1 Tax=Streptococcus halichoeri TaxID=254785 RepID=UPI001C8E7F1A|nr:hypothetical protein [Streptococcus halichoeri]